MSNVYTVLSAVLLFAGYLENVSPVNNEGNLYIFGWSGGDPSEKFGPVNTISEKFKPE